MKLNYVYRRTQLHAYLSDLWKVLSFLTVERPFF